MGTESATKRATTPALVRARSLSKSYEHRGPFSRTQLVVDALVEVDIEIQRQCFTALVGESGSGKSTLAACLALLEKPDRGEIWFEGKEVSRLDSRQLAAVRPRIQMVFQDSAGALNPRFSAAQMIEEPLEIQHRARGRQLHSRACELMEEVGLSADWADRPSLQFSGGQRQRLAIARALALQPDFLILDEALSGLDLITQAQILNLLVDLQQAHALTYLLVSHDLGLVGQIADFIVVMQRGRVVESGSRIDVLDHPQHEHTRQLVDCEHRMASAFCGEEGAGKP
jgi:ABC-type glutathione transport system ATPase component